MPKYKLGHDKYSFTEMYESLNERSYDDLPDEKLKKLYNQMKDERLSPVAAQQFKMIVKVMKTRKIPLNEKAEESSNISKENQVKLKTLLKKAKQKGIKALSDDEKDALAAFIAFINESVLDEDATANAKKSLDAIVGHLEKRKKSGADVLGATGRSMLKMGQGMQASYKQEGGFSPEQAKWIWKTSLALFK